MAQPQSTLFPKISAKPYNLTHRLAYCRRPNCTDPLVFELIGTVKLHGTHADIVITADNRITIQSRNRTSVTVESDVHGVAEWASKLRGAFLKIKERSRKRFGEVNPGKKVPGGPLILAGEWIGENVQRHVAISQLSRRFVLVNISHTGGRTWERIEDYADISDENIGFYNIMRGGTFRASIVLADTTDGMRDVQRTTNKVERECPFAKSFGIYGLGEGIVWKVIGYEHDARYWLKTKGPRFSSDLQAVPPPPQAVHFRMPPGWKPRPKPPISMSKRSKHAKATSFVKSVVSTKRLEQGWDYLDEMGLDKDEKGFIVFVKWLQHDVLLEEKWEIAEQRLDRVIVKRVVAGVGAKWFAARVEEEEEESSAGESGEEVEGNESEDNGEGFW